MMIGLTAASGEVKADPEQQRSLSTGMQDRRCFVVAGLFVADALLAIGKWHARGVQMRRHHLLGEMVVGLALLCLHSVRFALWARGRRAFRMYSSSCPFNTLPTVQPTRPVSATVFTATAMCLTSIARLQAKEQAE